MAELIRKYTIADRPNILDESKKFVHILCSPAESLFHGFIVNKLTKEERNDLLDKLNIIGDQLKHSIRIILNAKKNLFTLPDVKTFSDLYEQAKKGNISPRDLASKFMSALETSIDTNFKAQLEIGIVPQNEPHPLKGMPRGLPKNPTTNRDYK